MYALCVACRSAAAAALKLIDGDMFTTAITGAGVDPWFKLTTSARMKDIRAVALVPRKDERWAQLSNVTVSISSGSELGGAGTLVCATNIYATDESRDDAIIVQCPAVNAYVIYTIFVQRFSNGASVEFGLAEIQILRGRECYWKWQDRSGTINHFSFEWRLSDSTLQCQLAYTVYMLCVPVWPQTYRAGHAMATHSVCGVGRQERCGFWAQAHMGRLYEACGMRRVNHLGFV